MKIWKIWIIPSSDSVMSGMTFKESENIELTLTIRNVRG